jgi:hypothetical protein
MWFLFDLPNENGEKRSAVKHTFKSRDKILYLEYEHFNFKIQLFTPT